jgi:phosphohistidine phosphatase
MPILLLRHGPAGNADPRRYPDDRERALTSLGKKRTRRAMRGLASFEPVVDRVWTSPLVRARETAALLARAYDPPPPITVIEALGPGGDALAALAAEAHAGVKETLVLVGHEPDLGLLAGRLVAGPGIALPLKKAGACRIDLVGKARRGAGTLEWFFTPRLLRRVGKGQAQEANEEE